MADEPVLNTDTRPLAFVVMPLSHVSGIEGVYDDLNVDELVTIFNMFKSTFEAHDYRVKKSSNLVGPIVREIILDLDASSLVIADLTGANANVMYELGIRHAFGKPTIMLTQDDPKNLPFDLSHFYTIKYGWKTDRQKQAFAEQVGAVLTEIKDKRDVRYGPVDTYLDTKSLAYRDIRDDVVTNRIRALATELLSIYRNIEKVMPKLGEYLPEGVFRETEENYEIELKQDIDLSDVFPEYEKIMNRLPSEHPALNLILAEFYIPSSYGEGGQISSFMKNVGSLQYMLHSPVYTAQSYLSLLNIMRIVLGDLEQISGAIQTKKMFTKLDLVSGTAEENQKESSVADQVLERVYKVDK